MQNMLSHGMRKVGAFFAEESGQDLLEYAFVVSLIAFGSVAVMSSVAAKVSTIFGLVGSILTTNT